MKWIDFAQKETTFYFNFKSKIEIKVSALDAAINTVTYITKNYPAPYTLLLSGGVDSQAMLYAWHLSKVPYQTLSAVYNFNLNNHDLQTLKEFADIHKIKINFVDFDLFNFLDTELESYSTKYLCGSPQICAYMKLADSVNTGTAILSGNFIQCNNPSLTPNVMGLWQYSKISGKNVVPFFFLETEELAWAFNDYSNQEKFTSKKYSHKVEIYQHFGFPVIKQAQKYNGFEKVKDWFDKNCKKEIPLENQLRKLPSQGSNRIFDLLYRNKFEMKFSNYKYVYLC